MRHAILAILVAGWITGCGFLDVQKPPTPMEVQLVTQIMVKRTLGKELTEPQRIRAKTGLMAMQTALKDGTEPQSVLNDVEKWLGPENADIAVLLVMIVHDRVNFDLPPNEYTPYLLAVLKGFELGLG